jgi:predicted Fe-Mo cluster-binding NifX family protein
MRIAIATDEDFVASGFGCSPACTIVSLDQGKIRDTMIIPNSGMKHEYWADLFFRNGIKHIIVGSMGAHARSVMQWYGIEVVSGVEGNIEDVARRFAEGKLGKESSSVSITS